MEPGNKRDNYLLSGDSLDNHYTENLITNSDAHRSVGLRKVIDLNASKLLLIFAFTLLTWNIYQIALLDPSGYVVDIYSALPRALVPSLILCFLIATSLILCDTSRRIRGASIILLFSLFLTVLIIPYLMGYYSMGRADDMSYIGEYLQISNTGHFANWNIYPASLVIGATMSILTGIEAHIISFIIPILFSTLFVAGLYLFGRIFLKSQLYSNILLISVFILYLGPYNFLNVPHALFFAYMPIYLLIITKYLESNEFSYSAVMVILSLLLSFTHPFIFLFTFILLAALLILKPITQKLIAGDINRLKTPLMIQITCFLAWFIYSSALLGSFKISIRAFLLDLTEPVLLEASSKFATANLGIASLLRFLIIYYGRYIIPTIVIVAFLAICYNKIKSKSDLKRSVQILIVLYMIALAIMIILFINPIISHQTDRLSNLLFIAYFQVPLFALSLWTFLRKGAPHTSKINPRKVAVVGTIALTFSLSLMGTFNSPDINKPNSALTYNEVSGMEWTYEYRDGNSISAPISQIRRFNALLDQNFEENYIEIPDHFGYNETTNNFSEVVSNYEGVLYIVILTIDETLYEEIPSHKSIGRYSYQDYYRFLNDESVNRIYSGLNVDISYAYR